MIANVSQGLVQLRGNFSECIALVEVQAQSIALILGEGVEKSLHGRISDQLAPELSLFPSLEGLSRLQSSVQVKVRVEVPRLEVPPTIDRALIGHLYNPGSEGALFWIKDGSFSMDKQEQLLEEIIGFGSIAQDAKRNTANQSRIAAEQESQRFPALLADAQDQAFIREFA